MRRRDSSHLRPRVALHRPPKPSPSRRLFSFGRMKANPARAPTISPCKKLRIESSHCMNSRQWYICDSMRFGSFLPWQCSVAPAVGLLMLSGCSIVLNLDDRRCETHSQCSADGSSMCVLGICEEVETTTNDTTSSGTTTSDTTDSMSSTSSSNPGDDTLADDESSTSGEETTGDDSTSTSSSTSGTTGDETGSTGCSGDECDPGGEESTSTGEEGESSESTGEEPPPLPV